MGSEGGLDARSYLAGWAGMMASMMTKDISAIPDDKWTSGFGGCSKSASAVTADTLGMLRWTTEALKGNVLAVNESYVAPEVKAACATRDGAAAMLHSAVSEFGAALAAASDDALNANVVTPWGMPTPLFMIAHIAAAHIWYHDGQLNYVQTLMGDDTIHWMEA